MSVLRIILQSTCLALRSESSCQDGFFFALERDHRTLHYGREYGGVSGIQTKYSLTHPRQPKPPLLQICTGMLMMLLRNINISAGLCNRTRVIVCFHNPREIFARVLGIPPGHPNQHASTPRITIRLTERAFWSYHLQVRERFPLFDDRHGWEPYDNFLLHGHRLTHQLFDHIWAFILANRLNWLRRHNHHFCLDIRSGVVDALDTDNPHLPFDHPDISRDMGQPMILPSSHVGGDRFLHQLFQGIMCYVVEFESICQSLLDFPHFAYLVLLETRK